MDKAEEMSLLQYAVTVTEAYTQNEMRNRWCYAGVNVMLLGFAVLCLNTSIRILLSCDPGLEQAIRTLPGQAKSLLRL